MADAVDIQIFGAGSGQTWNKPDDAKLVRIIVIGAGGGGGSGARNSSVTATGAGSGGGGGGVADEVMLADDLPSSVTVDVGAGGAGGAARPTAAATQNGLDGSNGGGSSFGTYLRAGGGGSGLQGLNVSNTQVGGGGGALTDASGQTPGSPGVAANVNGIAGQATRTQGGLSLVARPSEYGGAGGGGATNPGGDSLYAGPGGGAGGVGNGAGSNGGGTQLYSTGGGAAGGAVSNPGTDGDDFSGPYCGDGGGGGGGGNATLGADGGDGGIGAGGGGGGAGGGAVGDGNNYGSGAGGAGGDGQVIVITYYESAGQVIDDLTQHQTSTQTISEAASESIIQINVATHTLEEEGFTGEENVILHSATNTPTLVEYIITLTDIYTNQGTATITIAEEAITRDTLTNTAVSTQDLLFVDETVTNVGVNIPSLAESVSGSVIETVDATAGADSTIPGGWNVSGINIPTILEDSVYPVVDTTPPRLIAMYVFGNTITLVYDENLNPASIPDISAYVILVNGVPVNITNITITLNQIILTVDVTITDLDTVELTYTTPVSDPVEDPSGNPADDIVTFPTPIFNEAPPPVDRDGTFGPSYGGRGISLCGIKTRAFSNAE